MLSDSALIQGEFTAYFRLIWLFVLLVFLFAAALCYLWLAIRRAKARETQRTAFSRALVSAQEEERARISRELHDTVAQDLRWLALRTGSIKRAGDQAGRENLCDEIAGAQSALIGRVRSLCNELLPPDFGIHPLGDHLRRLCHDFAGRAGIDCRAGIPASSSLDTLNQETRLHIFRIVQEALTNIEKHAESPTAILIVREGEDARYFIVSDEGKGFSPPPEAGPAYNPGLGIRGMRERAAIIGAELTIDSEKGHGTTLTLKLPREKAAHT
ncbi:MAG: sensor histidine kinase [Treponema sp.]|nr:sensor histidine kinase [Treponema sp.]